MRQRTASQISTRQAQISNAPAPVNIADAAPTTSVPTAADPADSMSPTDKKILSFLRYLLGWSYLVLLLIFLLFLLYKLWQLCRRDDKRRQNETE
jgi:hypothetical protein